MAAPCGAREGQDELGREGNGPAGAGAARMPQRRALRRSEVEKEPPLK